MIMKQLIPSLFRLLILSLTANKIGPYSFVLSLFDHSIRITIIIKIISGDNEMIPSALECAILKLFIDIVEVINIRGIRFSLCWNY